MLKHTAVAAVIGLALVAPVAGQGTVPDPGAPNQTRPAQTKPVRGQRHTNTARLDATGQKQKRALKHSKRANKRAKHRATRHRKHGG